MEEHIEYSDNKEIATKIIEKDPLSLYMFSPRLQRNKELVVYAVNKNPAALQFTPEDYLKENMDIVKVAVGKWPEAYLALPKAIKILDVAVTAYISRMESINKNGLDIYYNIPSEYFTYEKENCEKRDRVLYFLKGDGCKLSRLPLEWQDDFDIVKVALTNDGEAIRYASKRLQDNDELAWIVANSERSAGVEYLSKRLKMNKDLVKTALSNTGGSLAHFTEQNGYSWRKDYDCALAAVKNDGLAIQSVSMETKDYHQIALEAVSQNKQAVKHLLSAEAFSPDILDILMSKDVFYLSMHLSARVPENQKISIAELTALMKTKPQSYLLKSIKNALNSTTRPSSIVGLDAICFDLLLNPATIETLYTMRDASANNNAVERYLLEHIDNKKLMSLQLVESEASKKAKQRKALKVSR